MLLPRALTPQAGPGQDAVSPAPPGPRRARARIAGLASGACAGLSPS